MEVKIIKEVPVQKKYKPVIGKIYKVIKEKEISLFQKKQKLVYVEVNNASVGVRLNSECVYV